MEEPHHLIVLSKLYNMKNLIFYLKISTLLILLLFPIPAGKGITLPLGGMMFTFIYYPVIDLSILKQEYLFSIDFLMFFFYVISIALIFSKKIIMSLIGYLLSIILIFYLLFNSNGKVDSTITIVALIAFTGTSLINMFLLLKKHRSIFNN